MNETGASKALPVEEIRQALDDARAAYAVSRRLQETFIRYIVLANTGGIAACLGVANALVGAKVPPSPVLWPMGLFVAGLVCGGGIVSIQSKLETRQAEQRAHDAIDLLKQAGHEVPPQAPVFSPLLMRGLKIANVSVNVLGILGQGFFVAGAIWGMHLLATVR
jgi:hypothetical protein